MKNRLFITMMLVLLSGVNLFAVTATVDFGDSTLNTNLSPQVENALETELAKYDNMPDLTRAFGNANTYASHAATLRGYQGYDIFAVAVGSMFSVQAPSGDPMFFQDLQDELDSGDVYAGVGGNPLVIQAGLNLSSVVDGLYISLKLGKMNYDIDNPDYKIDYESNIFGMLLNYQIIKSKSILAGTMLWKGVSLESGFIYSNNTVSFYKDLDPIPVTGLSGYTATVDPSIDLVLDTKTVVVPIEVYTSIRLLYALNFGIGGGIDYVPSGSTSIKLKSAGPITVDSSSPTGGGTKGSVKIKAGTDDEEPDTFRAKLMANLGLSIGPVFIDMPASYYFTDNGYAIGISAGIVW